MSIDRPPTRPPDGSAPTGLTLTGDFQVIVAGHRVEVPHAVERLLAFLALTGHAVHRSRLAGTLWADASERQAANNLRTALWRLRRGRTDLVAVQPDRLGLAPGVSVDVADLTHLTQRLIHHPEPAVLDRLPELVRCGELLPDWDDFWVAADRERFRLLRLEALEYAAGILIERGHPAEALLAALAAVDTEPLRESARRLVLRIHAGEGNAVEAVRAYRSYQTLLRAEMGHCRAKDRPTTAASGTSCARCGSATRTEPPPTRRSPSSRPSSACPTAPTRRAATPAARTPPEPAGSRATTPRYA